jgi:type I restriction enzyme S subunit
VVIEKMTFDQRRWMSFPIYLPPLAEQQQIAEILDTVDNSIQATELLAGKLEKIKQGLLHDLLTRGLNETGTLRDSARTPGDFKQSPLGAIPESWSVERLGSVARITSGSTPPRGQARYWTDGSIPWVKTGEVAFNLIRGTDEHVTPAALRDTSLRLLPVGTLLVAMYGDGVTRGRCALLDLAATTNQACAAIEPDRSRASPRFLFHYLQANYERTRDLGQGSHQTNLSGALLAGMEVPLPPLHEQEAIADGLDDVDARLEAERTEQERLVNLRAGLMDDLLTGRVRATVATKDAA